MAGFRKGIVPEPSGTGPWFVAQYDGACADCGFPIEYGETICADGAGGYLCGDCGEEAKEKERERAGEREAEGFDRHGVSGYEL